MRPAGHNLGRGDGHVPTAALVAKELVRGEQRPLAALADDGNVTVMMDSIMDIPDIEIWIFQEQDGELVSWYNLREGNELTHVLPDVECTIQVNIGCTLTIERC